MTLERNHALFFCNRWWFHASYGCLQFQNCAICETASGLFFYGNNFLDSILAIDLFLGKERLFSHLLQQPAAVDDFFDQVERQIEILTGRLETNP